jgi:hypothetical protein
MSSLKRAGSSKSLVKGTPSVCAGAELDPHATAVEEARLLDDVPGLQRRRPVLAGAAPACISRRPAEQAGAAGCGAPPCMAWRCAADAAGSPSESLTTRTSVDRITASGPPDSLQRGTHARQRTAAAVGSGSAWSPPSSRPGATCRPRRCSPPSSASALHGPQSSERARPAWPHGRAQGRPRIVPRPATNAGSRRRRTRRCHGRRRRSPSRCRR